jgi:Na+/alanine symporter
MARSISSAAFSSAPGRGSMASTVITTTVAVSMARATATVGAGIGMATDSAAVTDSMARTWFAAAMDFTAVADSMARAVLAVAVDSMVVAEATAAAIGNRDEVIRLDRNGWRHRLPAVFHFW